jgi:uncharacterized cupredoxin-like copper-binding protein
VASGSDLAYQWQHNGTNIVGATGSELSLENVQAGQAGTYTVVVSNAGGSVSASAGLTVVVSRVEPPVIVRGPQSQTVAAGTDVTFTVEATGAGTLQYQWQHNGANIAGATTSRLVLEQVQVSQAGTYTVVVSNDGGSVSDSASLGVTTGTVAPPVIVSGPQSPTVPAGGDTSLTVVASGNDLTYQWQHEGTNIAGATGSSLSLTNVQSGDAGQYVVVVSNPGGSVTSEPGVVRVIEPVLPPVIVRGPESQTVVVGSSVSFTVEATGAGTLEYQWQHNGTNIAGATSSQLSLSNVQLVDAGTYTVVVSNAGGSASAEAALSVTTGSVAPPMILSGPQSQRVTVGSDVSFNVVASGAGTLVYQWQHQGVNIAGATSSVLKLSQVQLADEGSYTVWVSNAGGSVNASASLEVVPASVAAPVIVTGPESQTVVAGSTVQFSVEATGQDLTYQWQHNGTNIAGATSSQLSLGNVQLSDAGTVTVVVSNAGGSVSGSASLNVTSGTMAPPVILSGPQSQTVTAGSSVSFSVVASGTELSYQWQVEGVSIAGATRSVLNLANVQLPDAGTYTVLVSNAGGSVSASASLTVTNSTTVQPPVILSGPRSQNVELGTDVQMSVIATNGTLTYQWRYYGMDIVGATTSILVLPSVQFTNAGVYDVVVANADGTVVSAPAILNVLPRLGHERDGDEIILTWPGPFILQEAPECTGPFTDVMSATSPYRVNIKLAPRKFFRLRPIDFDVKVTVLPTGENSVSVTGVPGLTFILQASPDLLNWINVTTNTAPSTFLDTAARPGVPRYYRAIPAWSMISFYANPANAPAAEAILRDARPVSGASIQPAIDQRQPAALISGATRTQAVGAAAQRN